MHVAELPINRDQIILYESILLEAITDTEDHKQLTEIKQLGAFLNGVGKTIMKKADEKSLLLYKQGIKTGLRNDL